MAKPTRRDFLGTTAAAAAGLATANVYADEASAKTGPADTINMGLIGCGGRGRYVMGQFMQLPGVRMIGVCDVYDLRTAQAHQQAGGEKVRPYKDFRKLLEDKNLDAVIVATTGHWHVLPTIAACQAGKNVYVEKPLGTSIGEGRAAVNAARKYDRIVQIGTQQRSWEHYKKAVEIIQSGRLGEISEVKVWDYEEHYPGLGAPPDCEPPKGLDWDFYCGPTPLVPYNPNRYFPHGHYFFFNTGSAWQVDWAVHHYDIVNWAMGVSEPLSAVGVGGRMAFDEKHDNRQWPDTFSGALEYGPCKPAKQGFILQYTFRSGCRREHRSHGKCFFGTHGSMILDRGGYRIRSEYHGKGSARKKVIEEESFRGGVPSYQAVFLQHVRNHTRAEADVETGHHASNPGHLMNISWRVGRKIHWDGDKEQVIGDPEANQLVTREYRAPWKLEI